MSETKAYENWQNLNESIEVDPEEIKEYEKQCQKMKNKEFVNQMQIYVKSIGTNLKYSLEDIMGITLNKMLLKDQSINLLGKKLNQDFSEEQVRQLMLSLCWFSYRKNMPFIVSKEGKAFSTDANWGCTIRVAQMFMYSIIWEHLERKHQISRNYNHKNIQKIRENLIQNFFDNDWAIFSIHKICQIGLDRKNADVGEFWRPNITISNLMKVMQQDYEMLLYQDKKDKITFNTKEIAIDLSTIGIIICQDVLKKVFAEKGSKCKCVSKKNKSWGFYTYSIDLSDKCEECDFNKTLIIMCFLRTGLVKPEPENVNYINKLISSEFFAGGIIGKGNSAFFLLGNQGKNYIYLDPHYVQESKNSKTQQNFNSYNVQNFRTIDENNVNPCVGLALRSRSFAEFKKLEQHIDELQTKFKDSFYLSFNYNDENIQDMADAQPMQEAMAEEALIPDEDIEQSPVDENDDINSAEEDNVLKSPQNIQAEKIQQNLEKCKQHIDECLDRIEDPEWTEQAIQKCIGPDHLKTKLTVHYERDRILSFFDQQARQVMWDKCYMEAGEDLEMSQSCDSMESDTIDFLWSTLDFSRLLDINRTKYTEEVGIIKIEQYEKILDGLTKVQKDMFELLLELDSQSSALIVKIDNYIDERTEQLKQEIEDHPEKARMLRKTKVTITTDTPLELDLKKLPKSKSALLDHLFTNRYAVGNDQIFTVNEMEKRQQARQLIKDLKMGEELKKLAKTAPKNWMKEMLKLQLLRRKNEGNFLHQQQINVHDKYRKKIPLKFTKINN